MSGVVEPYPEDEQAELAAEFFLEQAHKLVENGLSEEQVINALLGAGIMALTENNDDEYAAKWLMGIAGRLMGISGSGNKTGLQ